MKPPHTLLRCHAHNRFSPSTALRQHFVGLDWPASIPQRFSSTAAAPAPDVADRQHNVKDEDGQQEVKLKRVTTVKGRWFKTKAEASAAHNRARQLADRKASPEIRQSLLARTKAAFESSGDYTGVVVEPVESPIPIEERLLPWCVAENSRNMHSFDKLAMEIDNFYELAKPTAHEITARKHVTEKVRTHVAKILPLHDLEVFGSERTGLAFPTSDIDFRLVSPRQRGEESALSRLPPERKERMRGVNDLYRLWHLMKNSKTYMLCQIRHARYPLLMLQDRDSRLDVQIVLANDSSFARQCIERYQKRIPYLHKLFFVVKTMFDVRGLNDVFRGGFGSYTILMMIVASIRHKSHPRGDAAGALVHFLKFYAYQDFSKEGISIEPPVKFNRHEMPVLTSKVKSKLKNKDTKPLPPYMLCLRDPADETNDLGRKAIAIKHAQATFKMLHSKLHHDLDVNTRPSLLAPLVGTSYMLNKQRRYELQGYGQRVAEQHNKALALQAKMIREQESMEQVGNGGEVTAETNVGKENQMDGLPTGEASPVVDMDSIDHVSSEDKEKSNTA